MEWSSKGLAEERLMTSTSLAVVYNVNFTYSDVVVVVFLLWWNIGGERLMTSPSGCGGGTMVGRGSREGMSVTNSSLLSLQLF